MHMVFKVVHEECPNSVQIVHSNMHVVLLVIHVTVHTLSQLSRLEKETILEYENHLAASSASTQSATITEANSYLLNQVTLLQPKYTHTHTHTLPHTHTHTRAHMHMLCTFFASLPPPLPSPPLPSPPRGPARRLLPSVIDLIKTVNRSLKLGQLLCRCRSPDFLLDVIKRQVRLLREHVIGQ